MSKRIQEVRKKIYFDKRVVGLDGETIELNSAIDPNEGAAILDLFKSNQKFSKTIEIGCAFGLSSLFIKEI